MMIANDDSRIVNKPGASLSDDPRVVISDCHMFMTVYDCGLYYKHMAIVNGDSSRVIERGSKLIDGISHHL